MYQKLTSIQGHLGASEGLLVVVEGHLAVPESTYQRGTSLPEVYSIPLARGELGGTLVDQGALGIARGYL